MDWENERYVRLYVRDTDDWLALTWQAKALFPLMLRKADRSGMLQTKRGTIGVAAQTGLPLEVVEPGLADLLRDGSVTFCDAGYLFPNFLSAQEARQSDRQRAKEARARRRELHMDASRNGTNTSQDVTIESRDVTQPSQSVTRRHTASHDVTLAVPSRAVPSQTKRVRPEPPSWSHAAAAVWIEHVGHTTSKRMAAALGALVTRHGWDAVRAAMLIYASPDEGPTGARKPEWFAENFQKYHGIAQTPLDDGHGVLTDRGRKLLGGNGRAS